LAFRWPSSRRDGGGNSSREPRPHSRRFNADGTIRLGATLDELGIDDLGGLLAIGNFGQYLLCVPPGLVIVHLRAVPDDIVLARSQGAAPAPIDSVSPQQFMKVVRAVQAALRP
jgi:hypothetical protein